MTSVPKWKKVESSNIDALAHESDRLLVRFHNGGVYEYENVDQTIYQELVEAESVGSTFHQLIRKFPELYPYKKLSLSS